jgi:hypothetical protein
MLSAATRSALGFGESAAMRKYRVKSGWTARSLALHTQAVLQGVGAVTENSKVAESSGYICQHKSGRVSWVRRTCDP